MWGRASGGAPRLLPLLLLLPGAVGLQCLSCEGDAGGCREAANVTCDAESNVCAEGLAAVTWSHGRFALGARGCGRGQVGANDRALELFGLVVFAQRRQCGEGGCNRQLPLGGDGALPLPGNESARVPNGVWCYGCPPEGPCPPDNSTVVQCYDDLRGCFHGNVTLTLGSVSLWREVRGCVRDESCTQAARGDGGAVALRGSCCSGNLCNHHLANKTFFSPDLPRLELLPHSHAHTPAPHATKGANADAKGANADAKGADADAKGANDDAKKADGGAKMADDDTKMAASTRATNGSAEEAKGRPGGATSRSHGAAVLANGTAVLATKVNGTASKASGATTQANMAAGRATKATESKGATTVANGSANGANASINLANVNVNAAKANGASVDSKTAAVDPKTAAVDPKTAAVDPKVVAGDAGRATGRPAGHWERKTGVKLPVDGGHAMGGPGWLLPLLLLALL